MCVRMCMWLFCKVQTNCNVIKDECLYISIFQGVSHYTEAHSFVLVAWEIDL